ncbi:MAG: PTS IIA-like nitrogen regulatory protein PtsN [Halioglobus sp.]
MQSIADLLTPGRTVCHVSGGSKKRLFETIATIISEDQLSLPPNEIFSHLIARERLGSTGLGKGIAIPHCRADNCSRPLGTLITLDQPLAYDAPDGVPVDLLFVLLVPSEEHQQHLDILAQIAGLFSQEAFCSALRNSSDSTELFDTAVGWAP